MHQQQDQKTAFLAWSSLAKTNSLQKSESSGSRSTMSRFKEFQIKTKKRFEKPQLQIQHAEEEIIKQENKRLKEIKEKKIQ